MTDAAANTVPISLECELYHAGFVEIAQGIWTKRALAADDPMLLVIAAYEQARREFDTVALAGAA